MANITRRRFLQTTVAGAGFALLTACQPLIIPPSTSTTKGSALASDLVAELEKEAQATLEKNQLPGMAVGIVMDGQLLYSQGFGVMDIQSGKPLTPQSVQSMASVSKAFTATAIMQLVEAGKMDIDQPLLSYLPYFQMADDRYPQVTIRHLLCHTAGMPALAPEDFFTEFENPEEDDGAAERLVRSLATVKLISNPGETFTYSDTGYDLLADVIAKMSGELFEEYIKQHIFQPLGMQHSTFLLSEVDPAQLVSAHVVDPTTKQIVHSPVFPYNRRHAPSSCLHSNVEDMSRWVMAHLNGGELGGQRILQTGSQLQLWERLSTLGYGGILDGYGWGWFLGDLNGHQTATSIGAQPGVQTLAGLLIPDQQIGIIALGNCRSSADDPFYAMDFGVWLADKLIV